MAAITSPKAGRCDNGHSDPGGVERATHSPARPVGRAVEPGRLTQGTLLPVTRTTDVDDLRVRLPHGVDVEAEPGTDPGPQVGDEHVGLSNQFVHHLARLGLGQIESDGALAAVGVLEGQVDAVDRGRDPGGPQSPIGITRLGMLNLDHLGTPVGQNRSGQRDEDEGTDLDDAHSLQNLVHASSSLLILWIAHDLRIRT